MTGLSPDWPLPTRGIKAEGRRASPGRPPARRLGCRSRNALMFFGFFWHKALHNWRWIAAPRPRDARLCNLQE
jgi:hypothetical protein